MEKSLNQPLRTLRRQYLLFWTLPIAALIVGENVEALSGILADNPDLIYGLESLCILSTAICIPLSLKLFSVLLKKVTAASDQNVKISRYVRLSALRLILLLIPTLMGVAIYYLIPSSRGAFCALIALIASLFCCPSAARIENELTTDTNHDATIL